MFQTITEPIAVAGVFAHGGFTPKKFQWKTRSYPITEITLSSNFKDGGVRKRFYSVMAAGNLYRLEYNRDNEQWLLLEVWCE